MATNIRTDTVRYWNSLASNEILRHNNVQETSYKIGVILALISVFGILSFFLEI